MQKGLRGLIGVLLATCVFACTDRERPTSERTERGDSPPEEHFVLDDRQGDKPLRLLMVVISMEGAPRQDIANATVRADWKIQGTLLNETDESLNDIEVHVEWYDAAGRRVDSGDAFVEYTMSETGIGPGRLAKFRFRSSTSTGVNDFTQVTQELLQASKVDLEITSAGRKLAYAPGTGWERLRNPPMRPATPEEIAAIRKDQEATRAAEAKRVADEEALMNRMAESYLGRSQADPPSGTHDAAQEQPQSTDQVEPQASEEVGGESQTRAPRGLPITTTSRVDSKRGSGVERSAVLHDRRGASITIDRLQTLRQTIGLDSLDHVGSGGTCAEGSEGSWSRLRGSAIKTLSDLTRVSSRSGADRDTRPEDLRDAWGTDFRFVPTDGCNASFLLWSAGPNQRFDAPDPRTASLSNASDDILLVSENGSERWVNRPGRQ